MEFGTSSQPPPQKDKQQVPRSPCKQPVATIFFLHITEGVRVKLDLLGYVKKIKYSNHYVTDTYKFQEFTNKFYVQTVGVDLFGEEINQPLQWETR
jgi:hypothetical protein